MALQLLSLAIICLVLLVFGLVATLLLKLKSRVAPAHWPEILQAVAARVRGQATMDASGPALRAWIDVMTLTFKVVERTSVAEAAVTWPQAGEAPRLYVGWQAGEGPAELPEVPAPSPDALDNQLRGRLVLRSEDERAVVHLVISLAYELERLHLAELGGASSFELRTDEGGLRLVLTSLEPREEAVDAVLDVAVRAARSVRASAHATEAQ